MKNFFVLLFFLAPVLPSAQDQTHVALLNLEPAGVSEKESATLTERLRSELVNSGAFKLIERAKMDEILQEQGLQQSGCTTDECAVEIGRLLNVQNIVPGSVGKVGNLYTVTLRMIDVETGEILLSVTEDCKCPVEDVLTTSMIKLATSIVSESRKKSVKKGKLVITTEPESVPVIIDGIEVGLTPFNRSFDYGWYKIVVGGKEYRPVNKTIEIAGPEIKEHYTLSLKGGYVGISDIRPGMKIEIDGIGVKFNGKVFVSAGRHEITFESPGFETRHDSFEMEDGQELTISAELQPRGIWLHWQVWVQNTDGAGWTADTARRFVGCNYD